MKFFNIFKSSLIAIKLIDDAIYYYMKKSDTNKNNKSE